MCIIVYSFQPAQPKILHYYEMEVAGLAGAENVEAEIQIKAWTKASQFPSGYTLVFFTYRQLNSYAIHK